MAIHKSSETDQAAVRLSQYAVISTKKVDLPPHRMLLDLFIPLIQGEAGALGGVTLHPPNSVCVVDAKHLEISIVVLASSQAGVQEKVDKSDRQRQQAGRVRGKKRFESGRSNC